MNPSETVRATVEDLITAGTTFDVDALDRIYHDSLTVTMVDTAGQVQKANKVGFKALFQNKKAAGDPPLNTWANFHDITVQGDEAHVLITRKVKLMAEEQTITLSIDLRFEDSRWQVTREVIFVQD